MGHDVIVIGSEAEGVTAAATAASAGLDVALVDTRGLFGRRPSASGPLVLSLLHETILEIHAAYRVIGEQRSPSEFREMFGRTFFSRREQALDFHLEGLRGRLSGLGVEVLPGPARFVGPHRVEVGAGDERDAPIVVIATGARARRPPRFRFDGRVICDPDSILGLSKVPRSLLVIGRIGRH